MAVLTGRSAEVGRTWEDGMMEEWKDGIME